MFIQIDNEKYECKATTFTTQFGQEAVRVISDAPVAENGFLLLNSKEEEIADRSNFTYLYRTEGDTIKEYTEEAEEIVSAEGTQGDVPSNPIQRQISALNSRVNAITPYVESKTVGIQDSECVFTGLRKDGTLTANVKTDKGEYLPCTVERVDSRVRISFDKLDTVATVTIQIQ